MYWIFLADYFTRYVNLVQSGSIMNAISQDRIENFVFALPPKTEQQQIYEFLDKEITQLDDLISKSQSQVNFLQEKRRVLITSAVTGKIDVRNGVAA